jgi:hypothetical protein
MDDRQGPDEEPGDLDCDDRIELAVKALRNSGPFTKANDERRMRRSAREVVQLVGDPAKREAAIDNLRPQVLQHSPWGLTRVEPTQVLGELGIQQGQHVFENAEGLALVVAGAQILGEQREIGPPVFGRLNAAPDPVDQ